MVEATISMGPVCWDPATTSREGRGDGAVWGGAAGGEGRGPLLRERGAPRTTYAATARAPRARGRASGHGASVSTGHGTSPTAGRN